MFWTDVNSKTLIKEILKVPKCLPEGTVKREKLGRFTDGYILPPTLREYTHIHMLRP